MRIEDPTIIKDLKNGTITVDELASFLLRTYPSTVLARELAGEIIDDEKINIKPIVMTPEQFSLIFRVQGWRFVNGQWVQETRGNFRNK